MNELYLLKMKLRSLYNRVPRYERDNNIVSPEFVAYNDALNEFISCGRKLFDDETLGLEQIEEKMNSYTISRIKTLLANDPQEILQAIPDMDDITGDAFMRLEYCLNAKAENPKDFFTGEYFANDRNFLASFTDNDIANFERLQSYIASNNNDVAKARL